MFLSFHKQIKAEAHISNGPVLKKAHNDSLLVPNFVLQLFNDSFTNISTFLKMLVQVSSFFNLSIMKAYFARIDQMAQSVVI